MSALESKSLKFLQVFSEQEGRGLSGDTLALDHTAFIPGGRFAEKQFPSEQSFEKICNQLPNGQVFREMMVRVSSICEKFVEMRILSHH